VFLVAIVALSLLTVPVTGGRLSRLAALRLRGLPLVFGALAVQIGIVSIFPGGNPVVLQALHLCSYLLAGVFLFVNRRVVGLPIIAMGAVLNAAAITANGGVMPASERALRAAGQLTNSSDFVNSGHLEHPKLLFLGDIFAIPHALPFHNVFSIGDVCIGLGAAIAVHVAARTHDPTPSSQTPNRLEGLSSAP
jgi:hypothetical protein